MLCASASTRAFVSANVHETMFDGSDLLSCFPDWLVARSCRLGDERTRPTVSYHYAATRAPFREATTRLRGHFQ